MKPTPDPLDRLFRAAARAPRSQVDAPPFHVEAGVLAGLRQARARAGAGAAEDWFAFLPLFRGGLAVAAVLALLVLVVALRPQPQPETDESIFLTSAIEMTYLP